MSTVLFVKYSRSTYEDDEAEIEDEVNQGADNSVKYSPWLSICADDSLVDDWIEDGR